MSKAFQVEFELIFAIGVRNIYFACSGQNALLSSPRLVKILKSIFMGLNYFENKFDKEYFDQSPVFIIHIDSFWDVMVDLN